MTEKELMLSGLSYSAVDSELLRELNATIGAGSVVTRDIPANVVAVGNPCKVIRKLK